MYGGGVARTRPPRPIRSPLRISWFPFLARLTLRQACRYNSYISLFTVHASRPFVGSTVDLGSAGLIELAAVVASAIRDADQQAAGHVIDRIADAICSTQFSVGLTLVFGSAVCPTHGVDLSS